MTDEQTTESGGKMHRAEQIKAVSAMLDAAADAPGANENAAADTGELEAREDDVGVGSGSGEVHSEDTGSTDIGEREQSGESEGATADDAPVALSEIAQQLGVQSADLYELEIPLGRELGNVTLGEMKDAFKEYGPVKEMQATLDQQRNDYERQLLATRSELNQIMQLIPDQIRGSIIQQAQDRNASWQREQEKAVLEAVPDWKDADKRAADRDKLIEDGAAYGFSQSEIVATQDARVLRMLRDFAYMKRELADMKASAKRVAPKVAAPGQQPKSSANAKLRRRLAHAKQSSNRTDKVGAVTELIRNQ